MKSRTFWINLVMVVAPSTSLTNNAAALKLKRKNNSTTLARTTNEQWILWALPWKPNNVQSLKHFASRRNWNPTSMNWKSLLTMPTRPTVKDKRLSNATKVPLEIPSKATKMKHVLDNRSWNKSEFPKEKPMHSVERSKNPELFWILPNEPRDNLTLNWPMPAMPSMKWVSLSPLLFFF